MDMDEMMKMFPTLLTSIMEDKKREARERNLTMLTCAFIASGDHTPVDTACYTYEQIEAKYFDK